MNRGMRHVGGSVSAAALVLFTTWCFDEARSGGVEAGAADVPERAGEVTLSIGTLEGPEPYGFGRVAGLTMDGDGRVYVADGQAAEVRVFSPEGAFLYRVGRSGRRASLRTDQWRVELRRADGAPRVVERPTPEGRLVERRTWGADVELGFPAGVGRERAPGLRTDSLGVQRVVRVEWGSPGGG